MSTVLFVKANNRSQEESVTVKLYNTFLANYKAANPSDEVIELDLYNEQLPYMSAAMINGLFKVAQGMETSAEEKQLADIANGHIDQFIAADKVVFAFPLWNMTVPAVLHTYIDYLNQAGKSFKYTAEGVVGLLGGKQVMLLNARGGDYSQAQMQAYEMAVNYVARNMKQFGITDVSTIVIEGHNQYPDQSAAIIERGLESAVAASKQF